METRKKHSSQSVNLNSGVTKVGVTGPATHGVTPKKLTTFFSHEVMTFFISSPLPPFNVVYPVSYLNSATKILISVRCHPLDGVTRGGAPPPDTPFSGASPLNLKQRRAVVLLL